MSSPTHAAAATDPIRVRPFEARSNVDASKLPFMVLGVAVVAALMGLILSLVGQFLYLIVLFPLVAGAAIGAGSVVMAIRFRMRSTTIALLLSVFGGVACMGTMHYVDFMSFESRMVADAESEGIDPEMVTVALAMSGFSSDMGFIDYLSFYADNIGVGIGGRGGGGALELMGAMCWLYWIVEMVVVAVVGFFILRQQVREPFDDASNAWMKESELARVRRAVPGVVAAIKSGQPAQVHAGSPSRTPVTIKQWVPESPTEGSTFVLGIVTEKPGEKKGAQPEVVNHGTFEMPYTAYDDVVAAIKTPPADEAGDEGAGDEAIGDDDPDAPKQA